MSRIVWLNDCPEPQVAGVGGKGGSLVRLCTGGFPVPDGFIITAPGYREWVAHNAIEAEIERLLATPDLRLPKIAREASETLRSRVEGAELPPALAAEVASAYETLRQRRGSAIIVAVRSSALSEDGAVSSSAGLYETYLNIRDEAAVLDGVARCYRSLWAHRAVQYRAFKSIDSRREAMAVVVMELVRADVSGVAFTVNPLTGSPDDVVINASWGLGEAIVSGRVTPDNFVVRKRDLEITGRDIYEKETMILPDPSGRSGTVALAVEAARSRAAALDDEQTVALARLCCRIEEFYGCPQDVEWAIEGKDLYLLQSRPVTALR
jgi:pyruvate,water dikinase